MAKKRRPNLWYFLLLVKVKQQKNDKQRHAMHPTHPISHTHCCPPLLSCHPNTHVNRDHLFNATWASRGRPAPIMPALLRHLLLQSPTSFANTPPSLSQTARGGEGAPTMMSLPGRVRLPRLSCPHHSLSSTPLLTSSLRIRWSQQLSRIPWHAEEIGQRRLVSAMRTNWNKEAENVREQDKNLPLNEWRQHQICNVA